MDDRFLHEIIANVNVMQNDLVENYCSNTVKAVKIYGIFLLYLS